LASDEDASGSLRLEQLRLLVRMVDAVGGVRSHAGQFRIDAPVLELFDAGYRQLVSASVARANADPLTARGGQTRVTLASDQDVARAIAEMEARAKVAPDLIAHFRALLGGTSADTSWSGVTLRLTEPAARALSQILSRDLGLLALLAPVLPHALAVLAIVNAAGSGLSTWIDATNGPRGIVVQLLFWVVPWVDAG
jgi:hypothetical protein